MTSFVSQSKRCRTRLDKNPYQRRTRVLTSFEYINLFYN